MADENKYNIKIECGTDFVLPFVWTDDNGNPYDLTGATVTAQLREYSGSPDALDFVCTHNNAGGRIMLIMPNEVTKQITYSYGVYDVNVMLASGVVKHPLYGEAKIQGAVTKPLDGEMLITVAIESYAKLPAQGLLNRLYYVYAEQMILRWNGTNYVSAFEFFELHPEGAWNEDTAYQKYATVTNAGSSYMALQNVPVGIDIHNTTYWLKLAEAGGAENIDDDAGEGDTTKTWSADKICKELEIERYKQDLKNGNVLYLFPPVAPTNVNSFIALIVTPSKTVLIDTGASGSWLGIKDYLDNLYSNGVFTNIDYFILSHYHGDHYQNLQDVFTNYSHNNCHAYIPIDPSTEYTGFDEYHTAYEYVVNTLTSAGIEYSLVRSDIDVDLDVVDGNTLTNLQIWNSSEEDIAYYKTQTLDNLNEISLVVVFRHKHMYSYFPGDLWPIGRMRVYNIHELPKVFIHAAEHHGASGFDDNYYAYLRKLSPDFTVMTKGYNRYTDYSLADGYGASDRYGYINPNTKTCNAGYGPVELESDGASGILSKGYVCQDKNLNSQTSKYYVDNAYVGESDGTETRPFKTVIEVLCRVNKLESIQIYVKGSATPYSPLNLIDFDKPIFITGQTNASNIYPTFDGLNIVCCKSVTLRYLNFNGKEIQTQLGGWYGMATITCSTVDIRNCLFDGSNKVTATTIYGIIGKQSNLWVANCTFSNLNHGMTATTESKVFASANTFSTVTNCYIVSYLEAVISGGDTVTNCTKYLHQISAGYFGGKLKIKKETLDNISLSLITAQVVSEPFYYNSTHPVAILAGSKIYDVLTGEEI